MVADRIIAFNSALEYTRELPQGVYIMNPYASDDTALYSELFYKKYYSDERKRIALFGINPGRFGAGITGVPFTDPVKLEDICRIKNPFKKRIESSSNFIYDVIDEWGSLEDFYQRFFISSLVPLGFIKDGKNYNYYDSPELKKQAVEYMASVMEEQLKLGLIRNTAFCLGKGTNFKIFAELNNKHGWFKKIVPLPHPRWVIQYNMKNYDRYIKQYIDELKKVV